jgi:integrase
VGFGRSISLGSYPPVLTWDHRPISQLKIPRCGLHAFRHFHSTMLLELGAAPQVAQAQMRHSDPRITLEVYSHVVPDSQRKAVEKVAEILDLIGPNSEDAREWIQ